MSVHVGEVTSTVEVGTPAPAGAPRPRAARPADLGAAGTAPGFRRREAESRPHAGEGIRCLRLRFRHAAPVVKTGGVRQPDVGRDLLRVEVDEGTEGLRGLVTRTWSRAPPASAVDRPRRVPRRLAVRLRPLLEVSLARRATRRSSSRARSRPSRSASARGRAARGPAAEDELMGLRMTQTSATYTQVSDADVARAIASRHGLTPHVQRTARPTMSCSSSTRATSTSCAPGPSCSRPRCGPGTARCTSARGTAAGHHPHPHPGESSCCRSRARRPRAPGGAVRVSGFDAPRGTRSTRPPRRRRSRRRSAAGAPGRRTPQRSRAP